MFQRTIIITVIAFGATAVSAQPPSPESHTRWQWLATIKFPEGDKAGLHSVVLTPQVLDHGRPDLADLRLYDENGREAPYALRIRNPSGDFRPLPGREFNSVTHEDHSAEVSLDLGDFTGDHNEVRISGSGLNYRRKVTLDAGDDGKNWKPLLRDGVLYYFSAIGQLFDQRTLTYSPSRFRYLRVKVSRDPGIPNDEPGPVHVTVYHAAADPGLEVRWEAQLSEREPIRQDGEYASQWYLSLPGHELVPWETLVLDADEKEFSRRVRLDNADGENLVPISQVAWERSGDDRRPLTIALPNSLTARRLRLAIVDQRNPPLTLRLLSATAAARQLIFERNAGRNNSLQLYFGNPDAPNPGYDIARTLPTKLEPPPTALTLEDPRKNPDYIAPPTQKPPVTERLPWLTYTVFGLATLGLLLILISLARSAIRRHDAAEIPSPSQAPVAPES